ncbi:hypothetical protein [Dyadobacter bucti]|uniref:hypothetical protein n=1 Tax=Dyadobacter bucti TaxID=2572203 RepID=UPI003F71B246
MTDLPICQVEEDPMIKTGSEKERGILEAHIRGVDALKVDEMSGARRLVFAQQRQLYAIPLLGLSEEEIISCSGNLLLNDHLVKHHAGHQCCA